MKKKTYATLLMIVFTTLSFLTIILTGCSSYSTDEAIVTTYTATGEYMRTISVNERIIEVSVEGEIVKLGAPLELLEKIQQLVEGEKVRIIYDGPPDIEGVYRLVSLEKED